MSQASDTLIDAVFDGRYRILKKLGSGGMANVYLAEDDELGRRVAIKILNDRYANDELFVERFRREAKSAAGLSHPNIVSIYDRGEAEGTYYIAMEVIDGRSLKEVIRANGRLRPAQAIAYTRQILSALRFAHRNGIIHRDIKPHNLMLQPDGVLKVMDFGVARLVRRTTAGVTQVGMVVGTPEYMAPEQLLDEEIDERADLYATGVVLYECLTGRRPIESDSVVSLIAKILSEDPQPPAVINSDVPPELSDVVMQLLAREREQRPRSAAELHDMLGRIEI